MVFIFDRVSGVEHSHLLLICRTECYFIHADIGMSRRFFLRSRTKHGVFLSSVTGMRYPLGVVVSLSISLGVVHFQHYGGTDFQVSERRCAVRWALFCLMN